MLPYPGKDVLVVTMQQGAMIFSPDAKNKFRTPEEFRELNRFLSVNWPYCGITLPGGDYAVGTITGGIIIFSPEGKIKNIFNKNGGLQDNTVYQLFCDQHRNLWAALDNGISRVDYNLPFVNYTEQEGLLGSVLCIRYYDGQLYIGTGQYLHLQKPDGTFERVPGTDGQNFEVIKAQNTILLAHNPGIFEIRGKRAILLPGTSNISASAFGFLKNHPDRLLVGAQDGLALLTYENSAWKFKSHVKGFDQPIYMIAEDPSGLLWLSSNTVLFKARLNEKSDSVLSWQECKAEKGLPHENAYPFRLNSGEVVLSTESGLYRYVAEKDRFERHPDFPMIIGKVIPFMQIPNGDIWFEESLGNFTFHKGVLIYRKGKYEIVDTPFFKFNDTSCNEGVPNVCVLPDSTVYFGTSIGLLRYSPGVKTNLNPAFNTLIRKVYAKDSLLSVRTSRPGNQKRGRNRVGISYPLHDLTFHFTATFYEDAEKNLFSYRLLGLDTAWSAWANDHKKEYTNLQEGRYTFEVKSKNQYQITGSTAAFSFHIWPPWYRRWWAFLGYIILGGLFVYGLVHFRTRNLRARSQALEQTVKQRTAEIREQKDNIEKLSHIGKDITSSLSIENIIKTVYKNVNTLMDASVFTIGLYKPEENCLEFPAAIEKGVHLESFTIPMSEENRLAVWCFKNREEVIINDYVRDYGKYVKLLSQPIAGETPESVLYLPLWNKDKVIGVISAQSFSKNAYSDYHVNMLRNLATYSAIALENADAYDHLAALLEELRTAQDRLVTQSKLAALGELTAGIAHEIQNPLNFVNNFSEISSELLEELKEEIANGKQEEIQSLLDSIRLNLEKINFHGKRADSIVKGMLLHSRGNSGQKQPTDINNLCDEFFRLAYHGLRAKNKTFTAIMKTDFDERIEKVDVVSQDLGQVVLNLISNAFYAVTQKKKMNLPGYEPTVWVTTRKLNGKVEICVRDNGTGIPQKVLDKVFQPFFTTKPTGEGTGLGLSLAYDIITKEHGGNLKVETEEGEGSTFTVELPV
jgi:signal transduction histidine kinase